MDYNFEVLIIIDILPFQNWPQKWLQRTPKDREFHKLYSKLLENANETYNISRQVYLRRRILKKIFYMIWATLILALT